MNKIAIIMGSNSDFRIMKKAGDVLDKFKIPYDLLVVSAHRSPKFMYDFALSANKKYKLIIAGAGGSAHLPGMVASLTIIPVIGVPIETKSLKGLDSLYSIIQMPTGTPVATMKINGSENAALYCLKILSLNNELLQKKLLKYKKDLDKNSQSFNIK